MDKVPVTVVIPAFNSERFIGEAIESVILQTLPVSEIIVVDNNCTDNTRKIAEDLGATVIDQSKQGASAARNLGIMKAESDWIAFLDSDDFWEKHKIERQWQAIKRFPDSRFISCDFGLLIEPVREKISPKRTKEPECNDSNMLIVDGDLSYCPAYTNDLFKWILMMTSTTMFHRDVFAHVGAFDEALPLAQDLEFFQRALARFPVATVKLPLTFIRKHGENRSDDQEALMEMHIRVTEKMLESPKSYPPGSGEFFRERMKLTFLTNSEKLSTNTKKTGND